MGPSFLQSCWLAASIILPAILSSQCTTYVQLSTTSSSPVGISLLVVTSMLILVTPATNSPRSFMTLSTLISYPNQCHPTRVSESTSSIFDLFLISPDVPYTQATVLDHAITDHYPISLLTSWSSPKSSPKTISCRSFKNFDASKFLADLDHIPWQLMDTFDDIDDKVKVFETLFLVSSIDMPLLRP